MFSKIKKFLFENIGVKQTIVKNTFWLGLAEVVNKFFKLLLFVFVARILGVEAFGKFNFALAFASFFLLFSDFALPEIITREFSQKKDREKDFYSLISLRIFLGIFILILLFVSSFFITNDNVVRPLIWILGAYIFLESFSAIFYSFLRAKELMQYESLAKVLQASVILFLGIWFVFKLPTIQNIGIAYLLASLSGFLFISFIFFKKILSFKIGWDVRIWKNFLLMSWPLALFGVCGKIYASSDTIMLGYFGQIVQTGWYNAGYKIIETLIVPSTLFFLAVYPVLSRSFKESKEKFQKVFDNQMSVVVFFSIPLMVGGIILGERIIDLVFGGEYFPAVFAFQILIIMAGLSYFIGSLVKLLIAAHQQKKVFFVTFFAALLNILLNLWLIPIYSLYGAASATLITFIFIFLSLIMVSYLKIKIRVFNRKIGVVFLKSVLSVIPMFFLIKYLKINVIYLVLIGFFVYLISFYLLSFLKKRLCCLIKEN